MTIVDHCWRLILNFLVFKSFICSIYGLRSPNVVIIMADDLGFDDVSFRGSNEFLTPNIDAFAYSGLILKNFYTPAMCTPSRAALLTGKYPTRTGMQHYVIANYGPWGLPLNETTMAEIFQQNGYYTSLIGKWHLGMSRRAYTPTLRGFDWHFGYLGAYIDYYDQTLYAMNKNYSRGHDFRKNQSVSHEHIGTYVTDLLTDEAVNLIEHHNYDERPLFMLLSHLAPHSGNEDVPLQAPNDAIDKFAYIQDKDRRIYAAMVSILDKSFGQVIDALYRKGVLDDTILIFLSDNGGPTIGQHATTASNYPLRGQKNSPWEGGLRSSAAIWYSKLSNPGTIFDQRMYIADLLPTLASAVGIRLDNTGLDGIDLWHSILNANNNNNGSIAIEREILHNIDDIDEYVSIVHGKFKLINGTTLNGTYDHWLSDRAVEIDPRAINYDNVIKSTSVWQQLQALNKRNSPHSGWVNITHLRNAAAVECSPFNEQKHDCDPIKDPCLFDIERDPCEMNNLYGDDAHAQTLQLLIERIAHHRRNMHPPNNKPEDPLCDPSLYHNEWTWWEDIQDAKNVGARVETAVQFVMLSLCLIFWMKSGVWTL